MSGLDCGSDMDCSDSDCGETSYDDYYSSQPWDKESDNDVEHNEHLRALEFAVFECLRVDEVERLLNESVELLRTNLNVTPSMAKLFLHEHQWSLQDILLKHKNNITIGYYTADKSPEFNVKIDNQKYLTCLVCFSNLPVEKFNSLICGHLFCKDCWCMHFETLIYQGISTGNF